MSFDKGYFSSLDQTLVDYEKTAKPKTGVTVAVKLTTGDNYRIARVFSTTDSVVSFLFYEKNATAGNVLPMVTVPYHAILSVEVTPSAAKSKFGFERRE